MEAQPSTSSDSKPRLSPYLALAVGILCLGVSGILVRLAGAPGVVTSVYRMGVASVVLAWPFWRRIRSGRKPTRQGLVLGIIGGLFLAFDLVFWATGVVMSGATNPSLLANTAPLWVGLGALVIFRERLGGLFWIGLLLAIVGAALILGLDSLRSVSIGVGTLFGLLAGIFYGGYYLVTQRGRETLDPITYFWPVTVSSTVVLLLMTLLLQQPLTGYSATTYLLFLVQGLVTQTLGYLAINYALGYLPASVVSATMLGQPVATAILAGLLLGEVLTPLHVVGGVAVLAGVFLVHHSRRVSKDSLSEQTEQEVFEG